MRLGRLPQLPDAVVRRILDARTPGASLAKIAAGLNDDAVPTAQSGARWDASAVRAVLAARNGGLADGPAA